MEYIDIEQRNINIIEVETGISEKTRIDLLNSILIKLKNSSEGEICLMPVGSNFANYINIKSILKSLNRSIYNTRTNLSIINKKTYKKFISENKEFEDFSRYYPGFFEDGNILEKYFKDKNLTNIEMSDDDYEKFIPQNTKENANIKILGNDQYTYGINRISDEINGKDIHNYYFTVSAEECIRLYKNFYSEIFNDNIRSGLAPNGKNFKGLKEDFEETIEKKPKEFYLRNNGVTLVLNNFNLDHDWDGVNIPLKNPRVINGAQTISFLTEIYYEKAASDRSKFKEVFIPLRIITNLNNEQKREVTTSLNNQNPVGPLDQIMQSDKLSFINDNFYGDKKIEDKKGLDKFVQNFLSIIILNPGKSINSSEQNKVDYIKGQELDNIIYELPNKDEIINEGFKEVIKNESFFILGDENIEVIESVSKEIYSFYQMINYELQVYDKKKFNENIEEKIIGKEKEVLTSFSKYGYFLFISLYSMRLGGTITSLDEYVTKEEKIENINLDISKVKRIKNLDKFEISISEFENEIIEFLNIRKGEFGSEYKDYKKKAKTFNKDGKLSKSSQIYKFLTGQEK